MKNYRFKIGLVGNPLILDKDQVQARCSSITLLYPYRLNAMALDPSKIDVNESHIYRPGEVVFSIGLYRNIKVSLRTDDKIIIKSNCSREQLVMHAAQLMKHALGITQGFDIEVSVDREYKHAGFGSSSGLIAGVAVGINELYGNPIAANKLIRYLAQNHGEEIENEPEYLQHVQCIGGGAAAGLIKSGMMILAGESQCIAQLEISNEYDVIIGVPNSYNPKDAAELMDLEVQNLSNFIATGKKYAPTIAYQIVHQTLPAMKRGDLYQAGEVIFKYRFEMGSIVNCSFVYPPMVEIANNLTSLYKGRDVDILALSSVGPAFFAITKNRAKCELAFQAQGLTTIVTKINNSGYKVINKE